MLETYKKILNFGLLLAVTLTSQRHCFALDFSKIKFTLAADILQDNKYSEFSKEESSGLEKEVKDTPLTGSQVHFSCDYLAYGLSIGYRQIAASELKYLENRKETYINLYYRHPNLAWVTPMLGYYQAAQAGSKNASDAPPAFMDKNTAFTMGLKASGNIYNFNATHSLVGSLEAYYLTTFEESRNFGNEYIAGLGYGFTQKSAQIGLLISYLHQLYRAEKVEEDAPSYLVVRSLFEGLTLGFFIRN